MLEAQVTLGSVSLGAPVYAHFHGQQQEPVYRPRSPHALDGSTSNAKAGAFVASGIIRSSTRLHRHMQQRQQMSTHMRFETYASPYFVNVYH